MPNLIVILLNLLYPVFIVGFKCKGCVIERESVKTQVIKDRRVFTGSSVTPQTHTKDLDAQPVLEILINDIMEQSVIKYPQINFK